MRPIVVPYAEEGAALSRGARVFVWVDVEPGLREEYVSLGHGLFCLRVGRVGTFIRVVENSLAPGRRGARYASRAACLFDAF